MNNPRIAYRMGGAVFVIVPNLASGKFPDSVMKDIPQGATDVTILDASAIPADRTFRGAWKLNASAVEIDMPQAREIQRKRIRKWRAKKLAELDAQLMRAVETGDNIGAAEIKSRKQILRDAPAHPSIDAAKSPEELKRAVIGDV